MRHPLFLICTLALFAVGFISAAHAHVDGQNSRQHVEFIQDIGEETDGDDVGIFYDVPGCSIGDSKSFLLVSKTSVPFFYYVQKRPPRT